MKPTKTHCVQCSEELREIYPRLFYCVNPKCPNLGLFQLGIEYLEVEDNYEKK